MTMRLSVFTAMMVDGRVFDGSGRRLAPAECVERIADAGFAGIEWGIDDSYALKPGMAGREAESLLAAMQARRLAVASIASGAAADRPDEVRRLLDIAARFHSPLLRVSLPPYDAGRPYADQIRHAATAMEAARALARPYRIRLVLELHFGSLIPSASLARQFLSSFDPAEIGAIYDPGNMVVEGYEDWRIGTEILGPYLAHVHAKNTRWLWTCLDWQEHPTDHEHWQWQFTPLDQGIVVWPAVIAALRAVNYAGWVSLEDFSTRPILDKLTDGRRCLSAWTQPAP